jgi:hypothetical protein
LDIGGLEIAVLLAHPIRMEHWTTGYTQTELEAAQERYGLTFPPDLVALLLERQPMHGYDWSVENAHIRKMLEWPFDLLKFDVENGFWWPDWGERPPSPEERTEILRGALARAPRLIPLYSHRFLPEQPGEAGNPVFSMHGFDTIYYGANLEDYLVREFGRAPKHPVGTARHIPFWSDIVEGFRKAYDYYAADDSNRAAVANLASQLRNGLLPPSNDP